MDYLNKAYKEFAEKGKEGITMFNRKNDSVENFKHELLALHIDKIDFISSLTKKGNVTYNELFELLAEYPDEIKFCKQLFIHRENPEMNLAFLYGIRSFKPVIISQLKSHFKLSENIQYFNSVWMTMVESWYSGLDVNNLTIKHMKDVAEETAAIIINLNKHSNYE
jgi:hypothetical protein